MGALLSLVTTFLRVVPLLMLASSRFLPSVPAAGLGVAAAAAGKAGGGGGPGGGGGGGNGISHPPQKSRVFR